MKTALASLAVLVGCLSGCSFLQPLPDRTRYFVLDAPAAPRSAVAAASPRLVGVGPVRLPDYLRRSEVVRRRGEHEVRILEGERWAEALDLGFARVLTEALRDALPETNVIRLPAPPGFRIDVEIPIEVVAFEADEHGVTRLVARWTLKTDGERGRRLSHESRIEEIASDSSTTAAVAAMSRALDSLAREIASAEKREENPN